jgi:hypothetical protein
MPLKVHLYNPDTKKSYCGMAKRGNVTPYRKRANCKLCDYQKWMDEEKVKRAKVQSSL